MLNGLLAVDRTLVELCRGLYKVPWHYHVAMREQNRRRHAAVRKRLLRWLFRSPPELALRRSTVGFNREGAGGWWWLLPKMRVVISQVS